MVDEDACARRARAAAEAVEAVDAQRVEQRRRRGRRDERGRPLVPAEAPPAARAAERLSGLPRELLIQDLDRTRLRPCLERAPQLVAHVAQRENVGLPGGTRGRAVSV